MARGRMIASTVADNKRFNELPIDAALVYLMAIPQLDRDGLILGEPGALWGQVCRRRVDLMPRMEAIIAAWLASGLVAAYKNEDGDTILHFVGFQKNQAMTHYDREAASRFPCPPGYVRTSKGLAVEEVRIESGGTPDQIPPNVMQSKGMESNAAPAPTLPQPNNYFGMPNPKRQDQVVADGFIQDAKKLGVDAPTFVAICNVLIDAAGWRKLIEDAGDEAKLRFAKSDTVKLASLGVKTEVAARALVEAYKATHAKEYPQPRDIAEYASQTDSKRKSSAAPGGVVQGFDYASITGG